MPDINVTFAGLPLTSPIIVEADGPSLSLPHARAAIRSGAGAIIFPSLDRSRLEPQEQRDDVTGNNRNDTADRNTVQVAQKLNIQQHLDELGQAVATLDVPVIAALQCGRRNQWLELADQLRQAGAAAVELRPDVEELSRTLRSEQLEKNVLRTVLQVAGRVDVPVVVRIPFGSLGLVPFAQAIADADAAGIMLRPHASLRGFEVGGPRLADGGEDARSANFFAQMAACRVLYRRVTPHLAVTLTAERRDAAVEALLAGATVSVVPMEDRGEEELAALVDRLTATLDGWLRSHSMASLVDGRGLLSESRLTSSLQTD